jgi:CheY-like chemotaxis protein
MTSKTRVRVLVVDDNSGVLSSFGFILGHDRYDVVTATNGREAWELISREQEQVDLIISDYNMPEMNGIGLLLNVRNDPRASLSGVPFILMSGGSLDYSIEELEEMCTKHGATFLAKPFSLTGLTALLEDVGAS